MYLVIQEEIKKISKTEKILYKKEMRSQNENRKN